MELGSKLVEQLESHVIFSIKLFGANIPVTNTVIVMWLVMAVLVVFSVIFTRSFKLVPEGKQNFIEMVVEGINNFAKDTIGHNWRPFAPYIGTIFLFLAVSNTISIFNIIPDWKQLYSLTNWKIFENLPEVAIIPPTKDINTTLCMGLMSVIMVAYAGIRFKGVKGWLKSYTEPVPVVLPIKIMENFIRMFSLAFRLFGNILGAFIVMEILYAMLPVILPAGMSIYFDLFDGLLQAFVFVFLTTLYISEAVE